MNYKYSINSLLEVIPQKEYNSKLQTLIDKLGISKSCFHDWRHITKSEARDIPTSKLMIIADFFNCKMEALINYTIEDLNNR